MMTYNQRFVLSMGNIDLLYLIQIFAYNTSYQLHCCNHFRYYLINYLYYLYLTMIEYYFEIKIYNYPYITWWKKVKAKPIKTWLSWLYTLCIDTYLKTLWVPSFLVNHTNWTWLLLYTIYHLHVYTQYGPLSSDKILWKFLIYLFV